MVYYLALFLILWAMLFTAVKFMNYYKICRNYKDRTSARVTEIHPGTTGKGKAGELLDVLLEYEIDGKTGHSEVTVPAKLQDDYRCGSMHPIRYMVTGNGAVHIASATGSEQNMLFGQGVALAAELTAFILIWVSMI